MQPDAVWTVGHLPSATSLRRNARLTPDAREDPLRPARPWRWLRRLVPPIVHVPSILYPKSRRPRCRSVGPEVAREAAIERSAAENAAQATRQAPPRTGGPY